jgi:hypothetical protein
MSDITELNPIHAPFFGLAGVFVPSPSDHLPAQELRLTHISQGGGNDLLVDGGSVRDR